MRLNRAMIFVNDLDRMTAFYENVLGLKPVPETRIGNYVEFDAGAPRFALHAIPVAMRCADPANGQPRETNPVKLSFEVDDVASVCRRLEALGVKIMRRAWGGVDGVDPEGNVFGISSAAGEPAAGLKAAG